MVEIFPALTGPHIILWSQTPVEGMWWRPESPVYHPYLLVSYGSVAKLRNEKDVWREVLRVGNDVKVMMDSGGFQVAFGFKNILPEDVLTWQLTNSREGDYLIPLDYPVMPDEDNDLNVVEAKASKTVNSINLWLKAVDRELSKYTIPVPLHGFSERSVSLWCRYVRDYVSITNSVAIGGEALKRKTFYGSVRNVLTKLSHFLDLNVKHVHVFGSTKTSMLAYLTFLEGLLNIKATVDSSTFTKRMSVAKMRVPGSLPSIDVDVGYKSRLDSPLPCRCPACTKVFGGYVNKVNVFKSTIRTVLILHNLYFQLIELDMVSWLYRAGILEKYIVKRFKRGREVLEYTRDVLEGRKIKRESSLRDWI